MSTRYMKKVYGGDILPEKDSETESDAENPAIEHNKPKTFNVFDVLNENSENGDMETEEEHSAREECEEEVKSKKKKKKRKKVDNVKTERTCELSDEECADEIEKTVREVNRLLGEPTPSCSSQSTNRLELAVKQSKEDMLMVQIKHLNPYNELKRIFGSKTVQDEDRRTNSRGGHWKKTYLVLPRKSWVPFRKNGLSMVLDDSQEAPGDVQYFMFEHDPSYRQTQLKFIEAIETLNLGSILYVAQSHLYHVDSLLEFAGLCKLIADAPPAGKIAEKALYFMECAFHPLFNVTTARCRLDYRKQQNRAFFIAIFQHLISVGNRACYRTSLEFCKLLLSLDPEGDPLAMVLALDFYALKAGEYEWFVDFCALWESTRNLTQLPNIAYGLALAHFHLGKRDTADALLQNALIMFPGVLVPLLEKCSVITDGKVTGHDFFRRKATASTSPALQKLQDLYIARSFNLWREADILPWLKDAVNGVLQRVDAKDEFVKFCEVKRSKRYRGKLPRNISRHIILSDIDEVKPHPQDMQSEGLILLSDPFPPLDSINIYRTPKLPRGVIGTSSNLLYNLYTTGDIEVNREPTVEELENLMER